MIQQALLLHPTYRVQIGSTTIEPSTSDDLVDLEVGASMDAPSNYVKGTLRIRDQGLTFKKGDPVMISLGYQENQPPMIDVFTGMLDRFSLNLYDLDFHALSSFVKLCSMRVDKFYEKSQKKRAGDIVKELSGDAAVVVEKASPGITFPYYSIDNNKSAYDHLIDLAQLCGYDVYANSADKLVFTDYKQSSQPHLLEYGKSIIRILKVDQNKLVQSVRVTGESPGAGNEHWLTKKKIESTAGSGKSVMLVQSRVVRDVQTAQQVSQAVMDRIINQSFFVTIEIVGNANIMLGDTVEIKGTPNGLLDGKYQTRAIEHMMNKSLGFTTTLTCRGDK